MQSVARNILVLLLIYHLPRAIAAEEPGLASVVDGLKSSREIVTEDIHPVTYLETLKVKNPETTLNGMQRYGLARNLLDCHHLCEALMHQSYAIDPDSPIMKLAARNFTGFKKWCLGEGGIITTRIEDYFESGKVEWGVDSTFETQTQHAESPPRN